MIVDDHPLMRRGIKQLISFEPEFEMVCEASNGTEALAMAHMHELDLILLDLNMKGMSGLATLEALRKERVEAKVVILTVSDAAADIDAIVKAGADGYLLKDSEPDELLNHLHNALDGDKVYSDAVAEHIRDRAENPSLLETLTEREMEILSKVALGYRNKQIADVLYISESTVKVHMKSLLKKLQVKSRTAATIIYLDHHGQN
ncbi:nitrate/nitrite response regulator protein [Vibrio ishigakensis]|uniref:Nitrate/nitrite response regulator protein n=1 Tax=Vibrio ishigakensis TaxID=1481914 RepID=A0A0B8NVI2_9VIBR|nr:response regulator [Vibrio ishigakensis]GAM57911.1 nitrate/nitrite response regulator protein [Vibrio ishigakensis]GAM76282.1 nitrate/nitrite response regulator protein [Vibrio ishigakensis]